MHSMLSFVSMIYTSDCTTWLAQLLTRIMYHQTVHHGWLSCSPVSCTIRLYIMAGSAGHPYHVPSLPPCVPIVLPHSVSFIKRVCPTVRPCLSEADRWREKEQLLRLGMKDPLHCAAYVLLPRSCLPNNILHSCSSLS